MIITSAPNPFTPDSAKSKMDKFSKITNWTKLKNKQYHRKVLLKRLSNEWSHLRDLSIELKLKKLCIIQAFTLGVKGLWGENYGHNFRA